MTNFRVHFADGEKLTVTAATPADARKQAQARHEGIVVKVKIERAS